MKISLILCTLNRIIEVEEFLKSAINAYNDKFELEIILMDQNSDSRLMPIVNKFEKYSFLKLVHIKSNLKGLAINRNKGIEISTGDILAFPDDDCTYYTNTLTSVYDFYKGKNKKYSILGRIYSRDENCNIIKNWPKKKRDINKFNFYLFSSSITLFTNNKKIKFDERLGVGSIYGSCEDPDYIYSHLKNRISIYYLPNIEVWHPKPDLINISNDKVYDYANGFGFFCRKNLDIYMCILLIECLGYKFIQLILKRGNFKKNYFSFFFSGLIAGFLCKTNRKS